MKLTFKSGKFVLLGNAQETGKAIGFGDFWKCDADSGNYVTVSIKAAARLSRYADNHARKVIDRAFVKFYPMPAVSLPPFLDPHQVEGVTWILTRSRSYLAHAPGAGKTFQAIVGATLTEGSGQVVFIVPPSLTTNWAREIVKCHNLMAASLKTWPTICVIPRTARQSSIGWGAEFLIVPDSMLTKPWVMDRLAKIEKRFIAVDEASRFKETSATRSRLLFGGKLKDGTQSPGLIYESKHVVLMDGSPMPNRPMELWGPTFAMSPESIDFQTQDEFGFKYCGARMGKFGRWEFKHSSNEPELRERLQKSFMHVVEERQLEHAERRRSILLMNEDVRTVKHREWERDHFRKSVNLRDIDDDASQGDLARFRAELGMRKVPWIAEYVRERMSTKKEAILLFAWHRDVCFELERLLRKYKPGLIIGGIAAATRERELTKFQIGETDLLIMNIAAGGRGHNLQRADRIIFGEFSWTDETNKQCEKRASRRGRAAHLPVRSDYIVCPNSMDEPILNAVFRKADLVRKITGRGERGFK